MLEEGRRQTGLPIITEATREPAQVERVAESADILQIGARNMQNFPLLKEVGRTQLPTMLKRGLSATIEEWLMAAEYIMHEGNSNVILCERGIRTFETATRNTLDLSAIPLIKRMSHLPIIADPSHGTGHRYLVHPIGAGRGGRGRRWPDHRGPSRSRIPRFRTDRSLYAGRLRQPDAEHRGVLAAIDRPLARVQSPVLQASDGSRCHPGRSEGSRA